MVKLWGGLTDDLRSYPGGIFIRHKIGPRKTSTFIKSLKPFDIQRMIISRYLMTLHDPHMYLARMYCKEFGNKIDEHVKKLESNSYLRLEGAVVRKQRDRSAIANYENGEGEDNSREQEEGHDCDLNDVPFRTELEHGKYDFEALAYKSLVSKDFMPLKISKIDEDERAKREQWERVNWLNRFRKDLSAEVSLEIVSNYRMVSLEGQAFLNQSMYETYLECMRYALKEHDWEKLALSLCGVAKELGDSTLGTLLSPSYCPNSSSSFWIFGFLAVINQFKDDVSMIIQFARRARGLFFNINPLYFGVHLAFWLIQKGFFLEAYELLTNDFGVDKEKLPINSHYKRSNYYSKENPKRDQAYFIYELVKAVYLYATWKRERELLQDLSDLDSHFEDVIKRKGEYALTAYERVHVRQKSSGADVMIFLEPFIELLVEYRSVERARDVLLEMWADNDGNWFFEKFFMDFMEKYSDSPNNFPEELKKMRDMINGKFTCTVEKELELRGRKQIKKLRKKRKKEGLVYDSFYELAKPEFLS